MIAWHRSWRHAIIWSNNGLGLCFSVDAWQWLALHELKYIYTAGHEWGTFSVLFWFLWGWIIFIYSLKILRRFAWCNFIMQIMSFQSNLAVPTPVIVRSTSPISQWWSAMNHRLSDVKYGMSSWPQQKSLGIYRGYPAKGPYLPCVSMAGRALLVGYHRFRGSAAKMFPCHDIT